MSRPGSGRQLPFAVAEDGTWLHRFLEVRRRPKADIGPANSSGSKGTYSGQSRIIAFITEAPTLRAILTHLGEPCEAPPISPCRGSPEWEIFDQTVEFDPIHPEPEYELDQSVSW